MPLPGKPIPYALSNSEIQAFTTRNNTSNKLQAYMYNRVPVYGVIIDDVGGYGQMLVWYDGSGVLHVIDVTNMSIANQVQKAPYASPDSSVIDNMLAQIQMLVSGAATGLSWLPIAGAVVFAIFFLRKK